MSQDGRVFGLDKLAKSGLVCFVGLYEETVNLRAEWRQPGTEVRVSIAYPFNPGTLDMGASGRDA